VTIGEEEVEMQGFRGLFAGDVLQYKLNGVRVPAGTQAVELMLGTSCLSGSQPSGRRSSR